MEMTCEVFIPLNDIATEGYECGRPGEYDERLEMVVCEQHKRELVDFKAALPRVSQHRPAAGSLELLNEPYASCGLQFQRRVKLKRKGAARLPRRPFFIPAVALQRAMPLNPSIRSTAGALLIQ